MAWTAPRTWTTSELVTAAFMNTHVRDNLDYLKGNAGTIALASGIDVTGTIVASSTAEALRLGVGVAPSASYVAYFKNGALPMRLELSTSAVNWLELRSTSQDATNKWALRIRSIAEGDFSLYDMTAGVDRFYINSAGRFGFGMTVPVGQLQAYGSVGGFMFYENSATFGSAVTIIPNAAGDVTKRLVFHGVAHVTNGPTNAQVSLATVANGGSANISLNAGADVLAVAVAADGSTTLTRTAGSSTWTIALLFMWL